MDGGSLQQVREEWDHAQSPYHFEQDQQETSDKVGGVFLQLKKTNLPENNLGHDSHQEVICQQDHFQIDYQRCKEENHLLWSANI